MNSLFTGSTDWIMDTPYSKQEFRQKYPFQEHLKNKFSVHYLAKFLETGPEPDIKAGYPVGS